MAKRRAGKKKRAITPEHLEKLQAGRVKAQTHKRRVAALSELETRLRKNGGKIY